MPPLEIQVLAPGAAGHGGNVGTGVFLRQGKGRDPLATSRLRQHHCAQFGRAGYRHRTGAESLHRKGEIGEPAVPGQRLAGQTNQPGIDHRIGPIARNRCLQQSRGAKSANQRTAGLVDVTAMCIAKSGCKRIERRDIFAMAGIEERPREMFAGRPA
jgi:hypothetical protein